MEFYSCPPRTTHGNNCFNSQRDGILPEIVLWADDRTSFNSQRDGILLYHNFKEKYNFIGFNSQRDEILPETISKLSGINIVSIPNGMEFYPAQRAFALSLVNCFNSQRDGILLLFLRSNRSYIVVSIPNGIEFYYVFGCDRRLTALFQFPTGWNSTVIS